MAIHTPTPSSIQYIVCSRVRSITIKSLPCFSFWWIDVIVCTTVWRGYTQQVRVLMTIQVLVAWGGWMAFRYCAFGFVFYWWRTRESRSACMHPYRPLNLFVGRIFSRAKPYLVFRHKTACAVHSDRPICILNWKFIWYAKRQRRTESSSRRTLRALRP